MMKVVISLVLLVWCGGMADAQQLRTPKSLNKDEVLVHSVAVYAVDHSLKREFVKEFFKVVKAMGLGVSLADSIGAFSDVVFVQGENEEFIRQAQEN